MKLKHEFVEFIPEQLDNGIIYISIPYATASHKCPCGCGNEVVTPLTPTDWSLFFDGVSIGLDPSVGNWSFDCKSHYWIKKNRVVWAKKWSDEMIIMNRKLDLELKKSYYNEEGADHSPHVEDSSQTHWIDRFLKFFK